MEPQEYTEGKDAFADDVAFEDNPYDVEAERQEHLAWARGRLKAEAASKTEGDGW